MTLYINGRFLTQPLSGVQRFAHEIVKALDGLLADDGSLRKHFGRVVVVTPFLSEAERAQYPRYRVIEIHPTGASRGHVWEQSRLYQVSKTGILLSLCNSGPLAHDRHVVAFHDAHVFEMPEAFSTRYQRWHRFLRPRLARRARQLITVSHYSAQSLGGWLDIDQAAFSIVPNAAEHILSVEANPSAAQAHGLTPGGYFLTVGNQSPNKNLSWLVDAHRSAGPGLLKLVVVGDAPPALGQASLQESDTVRILGRVTDGDLCGLLLGSAGFVFPSLNEGFGIPPLEAMQLGVPVLSSNTTAMPEVLGDAPMWFDPSDSLGMTLALKRFAAMSSDERARRIAKGQARAAQYSWQASAEALISALDPLFGSAPRSRSGLSDPKRLSPSSRTKDNSACA